MKTPFEILKEKYLLIDDDRTCECHTHLVIEAMEQYVSQVTAHHVKEIERLKSLLEIAKVPENVVEMLSFKKPDESSIEWARKLIEDRTDKN